MAGGTGHTVNCVATVLYHHNNTGVSVDEVGGASANADAAGYDYGITMVTPADLTNGFNHALSFVATCVSNGNQLSSGQGVYPSGPHSDSFCPSAGLPNLAYGMVAALNNTAPLTPAGSSIECQHVLKALHDYGMYPQDSYGPSTPDTYGMAMNWEPYFDYTQAGLTNAWTAPFTDMQNHGEFDAGSIDTHSTASSMCLNYVTTPSYWTIYQLNQGGKGNLPPFGTW